MPVIWCGVSPVSLKFEESMASTELPGVLHKPPGLVAVRLEAENCSSLTDRHSESVITELAAMISVTFRLDSTGRNLPKIQARFGCLPRLAEPAGVRHYESVKSAGIWP